MKSFLKTLYWFLWNSATWSCFYLAYNGNEGAANVWTFYLWVATALRVLGFLCFCILPASTWKDCGGLSGLSRILIKINLVTDLVLTALLAWVGWHYSAVIVLTGLFQSHLLLSLKEGSTK